MSVSSRVTQYFDCAIPRRERSRLSISALSALGLVAVALLVFVAGAHPVQAGLPADNSASAGLVSVIVQEAPDAGDGPDKAVEALGGRVTSFIPIVNGFAARIPANAVANLRQVVGVLAVTADASLRLGSASNAESTSSSSKANGPGWRSDTASATLSAVTRLIGAQDLWASGITGKGIGIALIDSGVVEVQGLENQVVLGPDLSFESQAENLRDLDTYGHGTHMAGIMVGNDTGSLAKKKLTNPDNFVGVAPGAHVISLKVASYDGATDVSQVLAAIDWVVQHRNDPGMNIRVLNLSFGTDSAQSYRIDPLAYAVEVAWRKGIVVVVAAGNEGNSGRLNDPAVDPFVIAVGAEDTKGTPGSGDDSVPDWSSRGSVTRGPDVVAPGKSVLSLRNPGCWVDLNYPEARVDDRFFLGSGTSQATAVVSGAAALLLQQRPNLSPDQVKALLEDNANRLSRSDGQSQGAGLIDLSRASKTKVTSKVQSFPRSDGTGSIEAARGTSHVADDGVEIHGEVDIFGQAWDGRSWSGRSWSGTSWQGDTWMGRSWSGVWEGMSWAGRSWSGRSWSENYWDGRSWSGRSWSGRSWSGRSWSGRSWSSMTAQ